MTADARALTAYIILKRTVGETTKEPDYQGYAVMRGQTEASSSDAAIKAYMDANKGATGGTYIAIPSRSWRPVQVTVKTETVVTLGGDAA